MHVVVLVKRVVVLRPGFRLREDGYGVESGDISYGLSESDAACVSEAVAGRESHGGDVVVMTAADASADSVLSYCLEIGADRAIRVDSPAFEIPEPLTVARGLAAAIGREDPDLVLCGATSPDDRFAATGVALAHHLGMPCLTEGSDIALSPSDVVVTRPGRDGGPQRFRATLPAVVTLARGSGVISLAQKPLDRAAIEVAPLTSLGLTEALVDEFTGGTLRSIQTGRRVAS
jgi:electron transfer flavoprotein alpha/beta subunit